MRTPCQVQALTNATRMQEGYRVRELTDVRPDQRGRKSLWIPFHQVEQIPRWRRAVRGRRWGEAGKGEVVIVLVFEEVDEWADVWMILHDFSLFPIERVSIGGCVM